ncbi:hypothetical protein FKM82_013099 [Ascaphus truei]
MPPLVFTPELQSYLLPRTFINEIWNSGPEDEVLMKTHCLPGITLCQVNNIPEIHFKQFSPHFPDGNLY